MMESSVSQSQSVFHTEVTAEECSITWIIDNFFLLNKTAGERVISPVHEMKINNEMKWRLILYPKGVKTIKGNKTRPAGSWVSLFLQMGDNLEDVKVRVEYKLSILGCSNEIVYYKRSNRLFKKENNGFGFNCFVDWGTLMEKKDSWLPNNALKILCSFQVGLDFMTSKEAQQIKENLTINSSHILEDMFLNMEFSDFTFIVENKKLKAHKSVLAAYSNVFKTMLKHSNTGRNKNTITISDTRYEIFKELLRFIYTGRVENLMENAGRLLVAAHIYKIVDLKELCEQVLGSNISIDNALRLLVKSHQYDANKLRVEVEGYIKAHEGEIKVSAEFNSVKTANPSWIENICSID